MNMERVANIVTQLGYKPAVTKRIQHAIFTRRISAWDQVPLLSPHLLQALQAQIPFSTLTLKRQQISIQKDTVKAAFALHDGNIIETVLMRHHRNRNTVCISSQAGCAMKCSFCATGTMGFKRNLTAQEMLDQVLHFARYLKQTNERVSNIVVMGMGEPMHNLDNVLAALRICTQQPGLNISPRKITISTCGVVPGIQKLANQPEAFNLAISLHAPNDIVRSQIMPVNIAYPLAKLMDSVHAFVQKTQRKVLFEYVMLDGINDTPEIAQELAQLMQNPMFQLNLIKYHATGAFNPTQSSNRFAFKERLEELGVIVTHRVSFGEDIDAACGQLANKQSS